MHKFILFTYLLFHFFISTSALADNLKAELNKLTQIATELNKPLEGSFVDSYGPDDTHSIFGITIDDIINANHEVTNLTYEALGIPEKFWSNYDFNNGQVQFKNNELYSLVVDNGTRKIKKIHIYYRNSNNEDKSLPYGHLNDFKKILQHLEDTQLIVYTNEYSHELNMWSVTLPMNLLDRVKIINIEDSVLDFWTRDWATAIESENGDESISLVPYDRYEFQQSYNYEENPFYILPNDKKQFTSKASKLIFEGGDVVTTERHIFIGPEAIKDTQKLLHLSEEQAVQFYESSFGKPIIPVGGYFEGSDTAPRQLESLAYHSDLAIAVLENKNLKKYKNNEVIILSSPLLALKLIIDNKMINPKTPEELDLLINDAIANIDDLNSSNYIKISLKQLLTLGISTEHLFREIQHIKDLKKKLIDLKYDVVEVPGLKKWDDSYIYDHFENNNYFPLPIFNYTNIISSQGYVFASHFDFSLFDQYAKKTYEEMGYEVIEMQSSVLSLIDYGGIRCLSQITYY